MCVIHVLEMRYAYSPISVKEFSNVFRTEAISGGGLQDIKIYRPPQYYGRGGGVWSFVKGLGRKVLPFLKKYVLPGLYNVGTNVMSDVNEGRGSFKESMKRRGLDEVGDTVKRVARGGNRVGTRGVVKHRVGRGYKRDILS